MKKAFKCEPNIVQTIRPYLRKINPVAPNDRKKDFPSIWNEGFQSFFNRAAYQHPTLPYEVFKDGILQWYARHPEIDDQFIRDAIDKVVPAHLRGQIQSDAQEREWAQEVAGRHNGSGKNGTYAAKFIKIWDTIGWKYECGKDSRAAKV